MTQKKKLVLGQMKLCQENAPYATKEEAAFSAEYVINKYLMLRHKRSGDRIQQQGPPESRPAREFELPRGGGAALSNMTMQEWKLFMVLSTGAFYL